MTDTELNQKPQGQLDDQQDLETLFSELSAARDAGKNTAQVIASEPAADQQKPEPEAAEPAAAQQGDESKPTPEEAAKPAQTEQTPAEKPPGDAQKRAQIDMDSLPPHVREYLEKLENERRAAIGRAAAAQREAASLKQRLQHDQPKPQKPQANEATAQLEKEFPELAAALKAEVSSLASQFDERLERSTVAVKAEALEAVFPGWMDTMRSEAFHYWLSQQPPEVQRKFDSDSLRDYASLLRDFNAALAAPARPAESEAARIKAERNALLAKGTAIRSKPTAPNPTGAPDPEADPEGYFNYLARKREDELRRSGRL